MGDAPNPNPNPFYISRYSSTATASPAVTEQLIQQPHLRPSHRHQLPFPDMPIPYFSFHPPHHAFASDPQFDFLSHPFHAAGCSPLPFIDSEIESETEAQLDLGASSEEDEDAEPPEDVDFVVDEEDNQVSFITDLFQRPTEDSNLCLGLALGFGQIDEDMYDWDGSNPSNLGVGVERNDVTTSDVDLELGLGLGSDNEPKPCEFASVSGQESSFLRGLRVVDIDSESDSDQNPVFFSQIRPEFDEIDRVERIGDFDHPPFCWDYLGFNQQQRNDVNHFDWQEEEEAEAEPEAEDGDEEEDEDEEVYNHDWEFEGSSIVIDPLVEADAVLFDWYHGRAENEADLVSIHTDPEEDRDIEEAFQGLEWEILFAVNNLNREFDDDDDTMFGVVEESMNEWRGNPPAAKTVIESLPVVHLTLEELKENEVTCTICWSEISDKEPVRQLPCRHYYHGDCIMQWLGLRNTCPVCRHELPTDDLEYECEKREMDGLTGGGGYSEDLPVSYENFRQFL